MMENDTTEPLLSPSVQEGEDLPDPVPSKKKSNLLKIIVPFLSVVVIAIAIPSIWIKSVLALRSVSEIRRLYSWQEQEKIRGALDLYHLKNHSYPTSLTDLPTELFLKESPDETIDLNRWTYLKKETGFKLLRRM